MNGIVNVLKPPGMSSHQVVSFLRKQLKTRRIGHTGTLDPGASGVLPLVVGNATRISSYITEHEKTYVAELTLGITTTSQDAAGATVDLRTDFAISPLDLADAMGSFLGNVSQIPPMASAVRVDGKRLYELERKGISIERKPRDIQIYAMNIIKIWNEDEEDLSFGTRVLFKVVCSKGTYIRTLCHDIGEKLGVGAHMSYLARTKSGPFSIDKAFTLEEIQKLVELQNYGFLLPMETGLPDWVKVKVNPLVEERISHGNFILPEHILDVPSALTVGDDVLLMSIDGEVLALAEIKKSDQLICQPFRVFKRKERG
ncbi:MAG: tRNA pseudouridine(55) synthase TruB [Bacillota bacterium]|nr:tRNA pseudouridine(55) synthase TruB [Bacillota bacterium]HHU62235.1 tRNA pseudouridine(55) synthase TruB [Natronincola sp.]